MKFNSPHFYGDGESNHAYLVRRMKCAKVQSFCYGLLSLAFCIVGLEAREVRTFFVQPPKGTPEKAYLVNATESFEVALPSRTLSPETKLPNGDITLAVLPRALAEGEEIPAKAPRVTIPEGWSRCYLLFSFDKTNKVFPVKVAAINASGSNFPLGHSLFINATSKTAIAGRFGKKKLTLQPRQQKLLDPPMNKAGAYEVVIHAKKPDVERPSVLCQSKWVHDPKARQLILAVDLPGQSKPRVFALTDIVVKKEQEN